MTELETQLILEGQKELSKAVKDSVKELSSKIDEIRQKGCALAREHQKTGENQIEVFRRLNAIEQAQAEGKGRFAIIMIMISGITGLFFGWVGRQF